MPQQFRRGSSVDEEATAISPVGCKESRMSLFQFLGDFKTWGNEWVVVRVGWGNPNVILPLLHHVLALPVYPALYT